MDSLVRDLGHRQYGVFDRDQRLPTPYSTRPLIRPYSTRPLIRPYSTCAWSEAARGGAGATLGTALPPAWGVVRGSGWVEEGGSLGAAVGEGAGLKFEGVAGVVACLGLGGVAGAEVGLGEFQEGVEFDGVHNRLPFICYSLSLPEEIRTLDIVRANFGDSNHMPRTVRAPHAFGRAHSSNATSRCEQAGLSMRLRWPNQVSLRQHIVTRTRSAQEAGFSIDIDVRARKQTRSISTNVHWPCRALFQEGFAIERAPKCPQTDR